MYYSCFFWVCLLPPRPNSELKLKVVIDTEKKKTRMEADTLLQVLSILSSHLCSQLIVSATLFKKKHPIVAVNTYGINNWLGWNWIFLE